MARTVFEKMVEQVRGGPSDPRPGAFHEQAFPVPCVGDAAFAVGVQARPESWVLDANVKPVAPPAWARDRAPARVALITDEEMAATARASAAATRASAGGLGLGMLNAQRAMLRVPALAAAWNQFSAATGQSSVGREILLQVSFAVSMANGCRYCTMHQVVGLRQLGVDPTKLLAMEKDDAALTAREKTAVLFARKLSATPWASIDADYATLRKEFQDQGSLEVLMQTSYFNQGVSRDLPLGLSSQTIE